MWAFPYQNPGDIMKLLLFSIVSLFYLQPALCQDMSDLIKSAEAAERLPNEGLALTRYKSVLETDSKNVFVLSKCSELCSRIGSREENSTTRDAWYKAAMQYANKALAISPRSDIANVSKAIVLGKSSLKKGGKEKIKDAKEIKRLVDIAIATNPRNYLAWHVLGRWNYEISNVNGFERTAAKLFFSSLPEGDLDKSIACFEKAKAINPGFALNYLELAKAYHKNDENEKALQTLSVIQTIPNGTEDDSRIKAKALQLRKEWK